MSRSVKITIDPMGNPVVEAIGFDGESCVVATEAIEKALAGSSEVKKVFKNEWENVESEEEEIHKSALPGYRHPADWQYADRYPLPPEKT